MRFKKTLVLALTGALAAGTAFAGDVTVLAQRVHTNDGRPMSKASLASPNAIVDGFLKQRGIAAPGLELGAAAANEKTGLTHLRATQVVDGLRVFGVEAKITLDRDGRVRHVIENFVPAKGRVTPAAIGHRQALDAAVRHLYGDEAPAMFRLEAEAVAIYAKGLLREGYLAEVWTDDDNVLYHVLVDGNGKVLGEELRTASDSYKIFADNPDVSTQSTVTGPGSSPGSATGWLFSGNHRNVDIAGNNVNAYLDTDANNAADSGGTTISDGNFVATADLGQQPSTTTNKAVAVQNLFYLNNVIHDKLYQHGFIESAGNFQESNGGLGGSGSDSVLAEAQDGSGTDNANFSTPSDGSNPRMQMYLWNGLGDHLVTNGGNTYLAMGAEFGPALTATGVTGTLVVVNDGVGTTSDGCETITTNLSGAIALIDRGTCDFVTKVGNAQSAGALGAIVANNAGDDIITMGGTTSLSISSVFVGQSDGATLRAAGGTTTIAANPNTPLMKDGDLDSDIVYHEYGHGLTWRMIGSMSGPMSGAIGEGMSDVLAILMNDRDTVGSYSASNGNGIRSAPYTNYPRTYGDFVGDSVHHDGEIYAATIWRLWQIFQSNAIAKDTLWDYLIQGMNFTVSGPTMENMRDGILQATPSAHDCLVWQAFAEYGIGDGAVATKKGGGGPFGGGTYTVTESFAIPSGCDGGGTTNQAPTASFSHSATDLAVTFTDASTDADGTVVSWSWSFGDGGTSTAQNPSHTYAAGATYTVTLTVTDDDGATDSTSQSVTVSSGSTGGGITLAASGYKVKGVQHTDLTWSGATSASVDVRRNGAVVTTTANDGAHTDNIGSKGSGSYTYQVCEAGTTTCSATVQVIF